MNKLERLQKLNKEEKLGIKEAIVEVSPKEMLEIQKWIRDTWGKDSIYAPTTMEDKKGNKHEFFAVHEDHMTITLKVNWNGESTKVNEI